MFTPFHPPTTRTSMMRYSFWHGHGCSVGDLTWLVQAFKLLKSNEWKPETPLYFDGSGWESSVREAAAISLLNALAANETAQTLFLQNADLDLKAQKALTSVLEENKSLRKVSLKNLRCNDSPMAIPHALFTNNNLTELIISDCLLDDTGCSLLGSLLQSSPRLESLTLNKVTLSDTGMAAIVAGLKSSPLLRYLSLRGIRLPTQAKTNLLEALGQNESIRSLVLEDMSFDVNDGPVLATMLARNTQVSNLSLRRNNLNGQVVGMLLDEGLRSNRTLRTLKLSHNPVGDDGAKRIAAALQHHDTLTRLCLIHTQITREGCLALCQGLATMQGLRHLALDGNAMEECTPQLLQAVQANVYIQSILEGMGILMKHSADKELWKRIDSYLTMNKFNRRVVKETNISEMTLSRVLSAGSTQADLLLATEANPGVYETRWQGAGRSSIVFAKF